MSTDLKKNSFDSSYSGEIGEGHTVLLVHGIRTQAEWHQRISHLFEHKACIRVVPTRYEYFDVVRFLLPLPFLRNKAVNRITRLIRDELSNPETKNISVIAHSFGTFIISKILQRESDIVFHRLIFCGSIVPDTFSWELYKHRLAPGERIKWAVINDCGMQDIWPVMAKSITWGFGSSGLFGFGHSRVKDRFHKLSHGGFFSNEFAEKYWLPFLVEGQVIDGTVERPLSSWWLSLLTVIKLKYIVIISLIAGAFISFVEPSDYHRENQYIKQGRIVSSFDSSQKKVKKEIVFVDSKGLKWNVPSETTINLASIPRSVWPSLGYPFEGKQLNAIALHSYYSANRKRSWQDTNAMFYDALIASGIGEVKAKLLYAATYNFGPRWDSPRFDIEKTGQLMNGDKGQSQKIPIAAKLHFRTTEEFEEFLPLIENKNLSIKEIELIIDTTGDRAANDIIQFPFNVNFINTSIETTVRINRNAEFYVYAPGEPGKKKQVASSIIVTMDEPVIELKPGQSKSIKAKFINETLLLPYLKTSDHFASIFFSADPNPLKREILFTATEFDKGIDFEFSEASEFINRILGIIHSSGSRLVKSELEKANSEEFYSLLTEKDKERVQLLYRDLMKYDKDQDGGINNYEADFLFK